MEITRLRLKNFLSFAELDHRFRKEAVLIQGKNLTEIESKETNGAGKSTMQAAIAYAILSTPLRKVLDSSLIMWGEEEAEIWLDIYCPVRQKTLNIHRTIRQKGSSLLDLRFNEQEGSIQYATVNDGNNFILEWIGISSDDLKSFYILNKENYKSFVASSNTEKLSLINRFINAEDLEDSDDVVAAKIEPLKAQQEEAKSKVDRLDGEIRVYTEQLEAERHRNLEEERKALVESICAQIDSVVESFESEETAITASKDHISALKNEIAGTKARLKQAEKVVADLEAIDYTKKTEEVKGRRDAVNKERDAAVLKRNQSVADKSDIEETITRLTAILNGKVKCPSCGHEFSIADPRLNLDETFAEKTECEEDLKTAIDEVTKAKNQIDAIDARLKVIEAEVLAVAREENDTIRSLRTARNTVSDIQVELRRKEGQIKIEEDAIKRHEETLAHLEEQSEALEQQMKKAETQKIETREGELESLMAVAQKKYDKEKKALDKIEAQIAEMAQWGLRMKEFRMSLACSQLKVIQDITNACLQRQKSELRVSIDGFKFNKKGQAKSEITLLVINGEGEQKSFWGFSGGERARVEMALIQAFQEMINSTNPWGGLNFLMIDEVLEGTDPLGLALLIKSLEDVKYPIYIISHVMNIRGDVPTLTVVKEGGKSYIEDE